MSIGIMDDDIIRYTIVPFNLEVMKISSYYKSKNELVLFAPEFVPDRHQKFFFRKDYNDGIYPIGLGEHENVEYGGLAFSNNKYVPLPIEIERARPDPLIYEKVRNKFMSSSFVDRKKLFDNMIEGEHCRLSLDGKTIWNEFERQFHYLGSARNLILHDYDLGAVDDAYECVQDIISHSRQDGWGTRLGMKFPIRLSKGIDLIKWSKFKTNSTLFSLRFDGIIEDEAFLEWVALCKERAVFRQMEYYITAP